MLNVVEKSLRLCFVLGLILASAACGGGRRAIVGVTPVAASVPPVGQWIDYATSVNPGSAIQFVSTSNGWRLDGQDGAPYLDQDIAAGPGRGSAIFDWPGSSVSSSSDGGATWNTIFTSPDGIWGIDRLSADTGWVVGVTALSRTADGGLSWQQMSEPQGQYLVAVDFVTSDVGYGLTSSGQLFTSGDGGASWSTTGFAGSVGSLCFTSAQVGYVADQLGNVYSTADGGATWTLSRETPIPTGFQPGIWVGLSCQGNTVVQTIEVVDVTVMPAVLPYLVRESGDGGATWTVVADNSPDPHLLVPAANVPVDQLAGAVGLPSGRALVIGFPASGWDLKIATSSGLGSSPSQAPSLPAASTPEETAGYVAIHGLSFIGSTGWVFLNDNAVGPSDSPETQSILLGTTDSGSSWHILQSDPVQAPPSQP